MANSIRYKINVEPREELTDEQGNTKNVISGEVGKRLGGSGVAVVTAYSDSVVNQGYKDATVNYVEVVDSDDQNLSGELSASFVFIKNTGHTFSTATILGVALDKSIRVKYYNGTANILISILDKGECICFKDDNGGISGSNFKLRTVDTDGTENASAGHLAVEYLVVD